MSHDSHVRHADNSLMWKCMLRGNPARAAELGRKSGQTRRCVLSSEKTDPELEPPQTAQQVRDALGHAMADVRGRRLDPKIASTMGYLASVLLKSIDVSDSEQRLGALEYIVKQGPDQQGPDQN